MNLHLEQNVDLLLIENTNLQEEVKKWETLYFETAEIGAAQMSRLEEELEQLRASSKSRHEKERKSNAI